jgi:hypothetical protein
MHAIPDEQKIELLQELTESTMSRFFYKMEMPQTEYSYVTHIAKTDDKMPDGTLKDVDGEKAFLHSHVVLAATIPGDGNVREPYKLYGNDLSKLHEAGREALEDIWTRELGRERVQELNQELEELTRYIEELNQERYSIEGQDIDKALSELTFNNELIENNRNKNQAFLEQLREQRLRENQEIGISEFPEQAIIEPMYENREFEFLDQEPLTIPGNYIEQDTHVDNDIIEVSVFTHQEIELPVYESREPEQPNQEPIHELIQQVSFQHDEIEELLAIERELAEENLHEQESADEKYLITEKSQEESEHETAINAYEDLAELLEEYEKQPMKQRSRDQIEELIEEYEDLYKLEANEQLDITQEDDLERLLADYEEIAATKGQTELSNRDLTDLLAEIDDTQTARLPDEQEIENYLNSLDQNQQMDNTPNITDDYDDYPDL